MARGSRQQLVPSKRSRQLLAKVAESRHGLQRAALRREIEQVQLSSNRQRGFPDPAGAGASEAFSQTRSFVIMKQIKTLMAFVAVVAISGMALA